MVAFPETETLRKRAEFYLISSSKLDVEMRLDFKMVHRYESHEL